MRSGMRSALAQLGVHLDDRWQLVWMQRPRVSQQSIARECAGGRALFHQESVNNLVGYSNGAQFTQMSMTCVSFVSDFCVSRKVCDGFEKTCPSHWRAAVFEVLSVCPGGCGTRPRPNEGEPCFGARETRDGRAGACLLLVLLQRYTPGFSLFIALSIFFSWESVTFGIGSSPSPLGVVGGPPLSGPSRLAVLSNSRAID